MSNRGNDLLKDNIQARAFSLGFCLCGFTNLEPPQHFPVYEKWVKHGFNGEMQYLASDRHLKARMDPRLLAPRAKSIVVLGWPYPLNKNDSQASAGQISGYVGQQDYHRLLPEKILELVQFIQTQVHSEPEYQIFTDSAPILERELASRAGLGWIGKNSCLISPKKGSAFLLAELFLAIELTPDLPFAADHCGTCQRCIQACPTQCIRSDRTLDASRCISTLTIENKGYIPESLAAQVTTHLFGCDICQSVCPWNRFAETTGKTNFFSIAEMAEMLKLQDLEFKERFRGQSILRAKRRGWIRNLCTVLANLKATEVLPALQELFRSETEAVIRHSAAAALMKIDPVGSRPGLLQAIKTEADPEIKKSLLRLVK